MYFTIQDIPITMGICNYSGRPSPTFAFRTLRVLFSPLTRLKMLICGGGALLGSQCMENQSLLRASTAIHWFPYIGSWIVMIFLLIVYCFSYIKDTIFGRKMQMKSRNSMEKWEKLWYNEANLRDGKEAQWIKRRSNMPGFAWYISLVASAAVYMVLLWVR